MKATNIFTHPFGRVLGLIICAGALTACCGLPAHFADGKGGPRKPPAETLDACKSLTSGQDCSYSHPRGTVQGTCWAPDSKPLACKPKGAPAGASTALKP